MEAKFYRCQHCGNIIYKLHDSGVAVVCCGEEMQLLISNTVDASVEKHVPVLIKKSDKIEIKIGEVPHPMTPQHYIEWIAVVTSGDISVHYLKPGDEPVANFNLTTVDQTFSYCNLHGLWRL